MAEASNIRTFAIAIVVTLAFIFTFSQIITSITEDPVYNNTVPEEISNLSEVSSRLINTNDNTSNDIGNVLSGQSVSTSGGSEATILDDVWAGVRTPFILLDSLRDIIYLFGAALFLPHYITTMFLIIAAIVAIFLIVSAALRKDT